MQVNIRNCLFYDQETKQNIYVYFLKKDGKNAALHE